MITWYDPTAANSAKTIQDLGGSIVEEKEKSNKEDEELL
jgi:hypothetical protein